MQQQQHCHSTPPSPNERPAHHRPAPEDLPFPPELDPPPESPLPEAPDDNGPLPRPDVVH